MCAHHLSVYKRQAIYRFGACSSLPLSSASSLLHCFQKHITLHLLASFLLIVFSCNLVGNVNLFIFVKGCVSQVLWKECCELSGALCVLPGIYFKHHMRKVIQANKTVLCNSPVNSGNLHLYFEMIKSWHTYFKLWKKTSNDVTF